MKRIVRLTESDLTRIVRRVISERNILSEEYVLAPVPGNYSVSWMRGLLGVVMPTSTPDGGYQYGFFNDANKNKRLKVSGYIKNVDQLTPQKAAAKGYKYYFVVDTASDGSAVYKWSSSSGKSWNANSLTNTREISSVAWGASTAP
jgi:hypothetical protein